MFQRIEKKLDQWGRLIIEWWIWPTVTLVFGLLAVIAALLVYPGEGEQLMFMGLSFGQECGFKTQYGFGCFGCGMTRSWVYTARGQLFRAFEYNAAGALLFLWLALGLVLGGARLALRKPAFLRTHPVVVVVAAAGWLALVFAIFLGRAWGINPLP